MQTSALFQKIIILVHLVAFLLDPALKGVEKLVLSDDFPFRVGSKSIGNIKKTLILTPNAQGTNFSYALNFTIFRNPLK